MKKRKLIFIIVCIVLTIFLIYFFTKQSKPQEDIIFFKFLGRQNSEQEQNPEINLKVSYNNVEFKDLNLFDTIYSNNSIYRKIQPGTKGEFSILLTSNENLDYSIKFQSKNQKPHNLKFKLKNNENIYNSLENMESKLKGTISKNEKKKITIKWFWEYESNQDVIDTQDGINIKQYNFTIYTIGGANEK
jgi:hypothetical protein